MKTEATLHFDGSAVPNPGDNCGAGFTLNMGDRGVFSQSIFLGTGTNNTSEYKALIHGLTAALARGVRTLSVFGDSMIVIGGMKHGPAKKSKPHIHVLKLEALRIASRFAYIEYKWVPRAENKIADALSTNPRGFITKPSPRQVKNGGQRERLCTGVGSTPTDGIDPSASIEAKRSDD